MMGDKLHATIIVTKWFLLYVINIWPSFHTIKFIQQILLYVINIWPSFYTKKVIIFFHFLFHF